MSSSVSVQLLPLSRVTPCVAPFCDFFTAETVVVFVKHKSDNCKRKYTIEKPLMSCLVSFSGFKQTPHKEAA